MNTERPDNRDTLTAAKNDPWRLLHRYWLSKHVDRRPPTRDELDPITEIPRLVANLMIIDATDNGFIYGFVGTQVVSHTGQDMTGQHVGMSRKYAPIQKQWVAELEFVRRTGQPRLLTYRFDVEITPKQLVLLLPLSAASDGVAKILGGSFFDGYFPPGLHVEGMSVQEGWS